MNSILKKNDFVFGFAYQENLDRIAVSWYGQTIAMFENSNVGLHAALEEILKGLTESITVAETAFAIIEDWFHKRAKEQPKKLFDIDSLELGKLNNSLPKLFKELLEELKKTD